MKRFLIIILALVFTITCAISLVACKDSAPRTPSEQEDPYVPDIDW